jgi:hypothetical protein
LTGYFRAETLTGDSDVPSVTFAVEDEERAEVVEALPSPVLSEWPGIDAGPPLLETLPAFGAEWNDIPPPYPSNFWDRRFVIVR